MGWLRDIFTLVIFGFVLQALYYWARGQDFWWLEHLDQVLEATSGKAATVVIFFVLIVVKVYKGLKSIRALEKVSEDSPAAKAPLANVVHVWAKEENGSMSRRPVITAAPAGVLQCASHSGDHARVLDKAILMQSTASYSEVRFENSEYAAKLDADGCSGFGEHVTLHGMSADEVCIGDVWRVKGAWTGIEVEVSAPAKPGPELDDLHGCRLRGRGGIRDYSLRRGVAGWHCRVLHKGTFRRGDVLLCVRRPHPEWTVRRAARAVYGTCDANGGAVTPEETDMEELQALLCLPQLASDWKDTVRELLSAAGALLRNQEAAPEGKKAA